MRKSNKVQVLEAVRDVLKEFKEWLQLPEDPGMMQGEELRFYEEFQEFKRSQLAKYSKF